MPSFSSTLEAAIHQSLALANTLKHELATLEHLLLALIDEPDAARVMSACAVDLDELRQNVTAFINDDLHSLVTDIADSEAVPTGGFQRVIQRAAIHVQASGRTEVTGANVLTAIFAERESEAAHFLQEQDMTRYDAVNFIAHGVAKDPRFSEVRLLEDSDEDLEDSAEGEAEELLTEAEWRKRFMPSPAPGPAKEAAADPQKNPRPSSPGAKNPPDSRDPFVFISYSSRDRNFMAGFLALLESSDISIWWDQDIEPGSEWRAVIAEKLEAATVILTLWTANSTVSKAVIEEASIAQSGRKLVHARMDDSTIPYGFGETQYVDLTDWDGTAAHPNFQRLIYAIQDKLAVRTPEFASTRITQSSPVEIVAHDGRLAIKDAPSNAAPRIVSPADLEARMAGLRQTVSAMCKMCADHTAYQLPRTLHHCLEALRLAITTPPVTWYALDDAKNMLGDCMAESYASETWNTVVFNGLTNMIVRIEELRFLLQPVQIDPQTNKVRPPAPDPVVRNEDIPDVLDIANEIQAQFSSPEGREVLDDNTKQVFDNNVEQLKDLTTSIEPEAKKLFKARRLIKGLAFLTGGLVTAISTGVMVNLLTSPAAAATLLARLRPIYETILQFFV